MASNSIFTLFLAISLLACFGQQISVGSGASLPCVPKLFPCQASLVSRSKTPPSTCCIPLKQTIQDDPLCLCAVFNSPDILKGLNITQADALNLAMYCQATIDLFVCKTGAGGPSPSSSPGTQSPPASSNSSSSTSPPPTSAAVGLQASFGAPAATLFLLISVVELL